MSPPDKILQLATDRGFGKFCAARKGKDPLLSALVILVLSVVPFAIMAGLAELGVATNRLTALALAGPPVGIILAIQQLVRGYATRCTFSRTV